MCTVFKHFLMLVIALNLAACANNKPLQSVNVVVMVQDNSVNSLPRDHWLAKRLINQVSDELIYQGMNVYDETAIILDNANFGTYRRKAELLDIARATDHIKLDYLVILSIDALIQKRNYRQTISTSIYGQTIKVDSGAEMGSFTVTGSKLNIANKCTRYCLNNNISDSLSAVSAQVSAEILNDSATTNIRRLRRPSHTIALSQDYALIFDGFTPQNVTDIEDYLVMFSGYQAMRLTESTHSFSEICYQSSITEAKLNRNLKRMLKELNIRAMINQRNNTITIKKITFSQINTRQNNSAFDLDGW